MSNIFHYEPQLATPFSQYFSVRPHIFWQLLSLSVCNQSESKCILWSRTAFWYYLELVRKPQDYPYLCYSHEQCHWREFLQDRAGKANIAQVVISWGVILYAGCNVLCNNCSPRNGTVSNSGWEYSSVTLLLLLIRRMATSPLPRNAIESPPSSDFFVVLCGKPEVGRKFKP